MNDSAKAFTGSIPQIYDRYMGPMFFEPFARDLAARFADFEGVILEIAAGTGQVTRLLAQAAPGARIVATDLNEPMLARAVEVVKTPNVQWRQADALALPFGDGGFDAVVCQFGAMFFPDKVRGYAEARRVLHPDGRFVFSVWDDLAANDATHIVENVVAGLFLQDPPVFFGRVPFGYHGRDLIRGSLHEAGFASVEMETVRLPTPSPSARDAALGLVEGTPLRALIAARDPARVGEAVEAATQALAAHFGEGPVTGTGQAVVITANGA